MNPRARPANAASGSNVRMQLERPWLTWLCLIAALPAVPGLSGVCVAGLADDVSIQSNIASLYVGQEKVVEGTVTAAQRDGNSVRLRLGNGPQDLTVSLIVTLMSNFPPAPERYYLGKTVRVAGTIGSFRAAPEIAVRDPADIQVVARGGTTPGGVTGNDLPSSSTDAATEDDTVRQRVNTLTDRLRLLEERVQRLERSGASNETR